MFLLLIVFNSIVFNKMFFYSSIRGHQKTLYFCPIQLFFLHPLLHLLPYQPLVNPIQLNQLRVSAPLHHLTILHHQDLVSISHCRQSVGDHQDRPTLHDPLKGFRDHLEL